MQMKQKKITLASGFIIACMLVSMSFLFSSYQAKKLTDDVWKMLGLSRQSGVDAVKNSFLNGYLYYFGVKNTKNLAAYDRAAITRDLLHYTKEYISSGDFKKQYENLRKNAQPQEPELKPLRSIAEIQKEEIAKTEKSIKDTEKTIKEVKADMAKAIQPVLDMLRQNLKDYQDPNHQLFASIAMGEKYQQENEVKNYNDYMKKWEKDFPENINLFIADKLKKMLEYTKDIDYNAALVEKYGRKRFVNPAYEAKRTEWKQGFRAGKVVTEQARTFAEKWLVELR
jgi:predicted phage tail protein